jgi:hypothetical protein
MVVTQSMAIPSPLACCPQDILQRLILV